MGLTAARVLEVLRNLFEERGFPAIYAILFGSLAKGVAHPLSDLDVRVRVPDLDEGSVLSLRIDLVLELASRLRISEDLIDVVVFRPVDVSARPAFFYEMLCNGILAWGDRRVYIEDLVKSALLNSDHNVQLRKSGYPTSYV
ncbi:nucleotidyltransferase domain-containing protein, partial [archaeon]|nr:nucleotidyltransferase domain-containing protein [archaeon]